MKGVDRCIIYCIISLFWLAMIYSSSAKTGHCGHYQISDDMTSEQSVADYYSNY